MRVAIVSRGRSARTAPDIKAPDIKAAATALRVRFESLPAPFVVAHLQLGLLLPTSVCHWARRPERVSPSFPFAGVHSDEEARLIEPYKHGDQRSLKDLYVRGHAASERRAGRSMPPPR
ncbi:MAG: hypothetical protein M3198_18330 [Actinomycetota bacterium]|nr:hypothetical protein [Actinomycetota bacterium]